MSPKLHTELLKIIWNMEPSADYRTADGEPVTVRSRGEYDEGLDRFTGAEILCDNVVYRGDVVVWSGDTPPEGNFENCILHVAPSACPRILRYDGSPLMQVVADTGPVCAGSYASLREGAAGYKCSGHVARLAGHERIALFTRLLADRLNRKCNDLRRIYAECDQNWNETMYMMLMRTMGDSKNKEAFTELARRVKYRMVSRERNTLQYVEALLLGASGFLEVYEDDAYIRDLKSDFDYLRRKHSIATMAAGSWIISKTNPNNHPVIRIAQLSSFLATREFIFENLIKCRSVEDLQVFFRAEASQYWSTHYIPGSSSPQTPKRIGHMKANLLGINLAVPMLFAYGDYSADDSLKERAVDLLEKITFESNRITDGWREGGVVMESAFDSQAILQLNNEYCLRELCWKCPVGKRVIRNIYTEQLNN